MRNALLAGSSSRSRAAWSAGSSCCAGRCSPATRSATSRSRGARRGRRGDRHQRIGLFAATIASGGDRALGAACSARRAGSRRPTMRRSASVFAFVLGLGVFFLALSARARRRRGHPGARTLFGSIFGLSARRSAARRGDRARRDAAASGDRAAAAVRLGRPGGRRARGVPCACSGRLPRRCSAWSPPRRRRRSARCCCSACSPRRPRPRSAGIDGGGRPTTAKAAHRKVTRRVDQGILQQALKSLVDDKTLTQAQADAVTARGSRTRPRRTPPRSRPRRSPRSPRPSGSPPMTSRRPSRTASRSPIWPSRRTSTPRRSSTR